MSSDSVPRAFVSLVRRNRRRYGGYVVHAGIAVLFVGIAASSTFQNGARRAPRARARARASAATTSPTCGRPARLDVAENGGAREDRPRRRPAREPRDGDPATLHPERSFFPSSDPSLGAVSRYFEGEATSEVGLQSRLRRDFWTIVAPDTEPLRRDRRDAATRCFDSARDAAARPSARSRSGEALRRLVGALPRRGAAGDVPGARVAARDLDLARRADRVRGGLITLWPAPAGAPRRARAAYAARLARELGRA